MEWLGVLVYIVISLFMISILLISLGLLLVFVHFLLQLNGKLIRKIKENFIKG